MTDSPEARSPWLRTILWATLFAIAHTQAPEYFSNQHQYYLHGFAKAEVGNLSADWLANTKDPTPAYTWLVAKMFTDLGPWSFHVMYFLMLGLFCESVRQIVCHVLNVPTSSRLGLAISLTVLVTHAAILRVASVRLLGVDYPWYAQAGLAAQYLLGPGLQPSVFGIFLVVSLALFMRGYATLACIIAAGGAAMHSTYLISAGLLVLGYMLVMLREGRVFRSLLAGALALAIVVPVIKYNYETFKVEIHDQFLESQWVLVKERIPHHALIGNWIDAFAWAQMVIMAMAVVIMRKSRLFPVMIMTVSACVVLTLVQLVVESPVLALLFPWRFSVVLMPIASCICLGWLVKAIAIRFGEPSPIASWSVAGLLALGGVAVLVFRLGYFTNEAERPLLAHVQENKLPGDCYLIPTKFPILKKESPASQSKTFSPPVRPGNVGIPVDFQRFRLSTGAPIYIDFKAPPYQADEVFEWKRRILNVTKWYAQKDWDAPEIWREILLEGITHVVVPADMGITSQALELQFEDANYRLYRIRTAP